MAKRFLATLGLPDNAHLGQRIYKRHFYDHGRLNAADKKAFSEDIELITWQYGLRPSTVAIAPYEDDLHEYLEVAYIQIELRNAQRLKRLAHIIHQSIPYPLFLLFIKPAQSKNSPGSQVQVAISVAVKRLSQLGGDAPVLQEVLLTDWLALDQPQPIEQDFLASLHLSKLPHSNFYEFYTAIIDRLRALAWARKTGSYTLAPSPQQRHLLKEQLDQLHKLEKQITQLRSQIRRETQFNRKLELNVQIKGLQKQLKKLTET